MSVTDTWQPKRPGPASDRDNNLNFEFECTACLHNFIHWEVYDLKLFRVGTKPGFSHYISGLKLELELELFRKSSSFNPEI